MIRKEDVRDQILNQSNPSRIRYFDLPMTITEPHSFCGLSLRIQPQFSLLR
uniref:Uncharacterized protein n=1 Tax=Rhizophora mucronata TaxID=61149 RepID=A0A2P2QH47_RHIMU